MKEVITLEIIKKDLLKQKLIGIKTRRKISNNKFIIIEDMCIENTHKFSQQFHMMFSFFQMQRLALKKFKIPTFKTYNEFGKYLENDISKKHKFYIIQIQGDAEPALFYDAKLCEIDEELICKTIVLSETKSTYTRRRLNLDFIKSLNIWNRNKKIDIRMCRCSEKQVIDGGNEDSDDYYVIFIDGSKKIKMNGDYIDQNGKRCGWRTSAFDNCIVGNSYYIAYLDAKPIYIFSTEVWTVD